MKKNGEKYLSKTAPEFVLFRIEAFREQNPFWVETDLSEALLRNYALTDTTVILKDTFYLFHRNKVLKSLTYNVLSSINFNDIKSITKYHESWYLIYNFDTNANEVNYSYTIEYNNGLITDKKEINKKVFKILYTKPHFIKFNDDDDGIEVIYFV
jgi:hypothetical protein